MILFLRVICFFPGKTSFGKPPGVAKALKSETAGKNLLAASTVVSRQCPKNTNGYIPEIADAYFWLFEISLIVTWNMIKLALKIHTCNVGGGI